MEEHTLGVFENRVLRTLIESERVEGRGEWRKLHNEDLHNLYSSPNIVRRRNTHVYKIWLERLKGGGHSEDLSVDGKIILK
jgi:hypothetical protein